MLLNYTPNRNCIFSPVVFWNTREAGYGHYPASNVAGLNDNCQEAACKEYDCYKCVLGRQKDFLKQKSGIEEPYDAYNLEHGTQHRCLFLPKFHPELNYIESYWGRMKYYVRLYLIAQHQRSRSIC